MLTPIHIYNIYIINIYNIYYSKLKGNGDHKNGWMEEGKTDSTYQGRNKTDGKKLEIRRAARQDCNIPIKFVWISGKEKRQGFFPALNDCLSVNIKSAITRRKYDIVRYISCPIGKHNARN